MCKDHMVWTASVSARNKRSNRCSLASRPADAAPTFARLSPSPAHCALTQLTAAGEAASETLSSAVRLLVSRAAVSKQQVGAVLSENTKRAEPPC